MLEPTDGADTEISRHWRIEVEFKVVFLEEMLRVREYLPLYSQMTCW